MKAIQLAYAGLLLVLVGVWAWAWAEPALRGPADFITLRNALVQGSGIVAIGVMSAGLVLAARPIFVEPWLGGLDKMYRLHKWLGITALVAAVLHWVATQAPKWLLALGWIEQGARVRRAPPSEPLATWLYSQRGLAETLGEWAFYAMVVMIVLALVRRFPYRWFFLTHRLLALLYLVLVFHGVVLLRYADWATPVGGLVGGMMFAGSFAAVFILLGRVGASRRAVGEVESVEYLDGVQVLEVAIRLKSRWQPHAAGQFAFMSFDAHEGPHPFTIVSAAHDTGRLRVLIKGLGDYTLSLPRRLKPGALVTLEGPYGQFTFNGAARQQIWVGGGIGITPFIARMKHLAQKSDGRSIDLFHSTAAIDDGTEDRLRHDAHAAHVRLHLTVDGQQARLDARRICDAVPQWSEADVWFCGPAAFGRALKRQFRARGLAAGRFHQELFQMR